MRKLKSLALGLGVMLAVTVTTTSFVSADQGNPQIEGADKAQQGLVDAAIADCRRQSAANSAGQDIFLSTATPKTYTGLAWQNVDCAGTTFRLQFGQRALVVADFNAESDCNGSAPTNGQWCETRALLNGLEGTPVAAEPSSFAFDAVAGGVNNWQANSMQRGWEIRCAVVNGCQYRFNVQTQMHNATVTGMWLDEIAAHVRVTYGNPAPL